MSESPVMLSADQMRIRYAGFYKANRLLSLDRSKVPARFWPLLPYAELWGMADESMRCRLLKEAPEIARRDLKAIIAAFDIELDDWLAGPEADDLNPSDEYIAFSAMRMAAYAA